MSSADPLADTSPVDTAEPSLLHRVTVLLHTIRAVFGGLCTLAAMEVRLAGLSVIAILVLGVATGVLLTATWLLLMAVLAMWLVQMGLGWGLALLCIVPINLLAGAGLIMFICRFSRNLVFSATRRQVSALAREKIYAKNKATETSDS